MSATNLPSASLYSSPGFPQALDVVVTSLDQVISRIAAKPELDRCEGIVWSDALGLNVIVCNKPAAVHDLETDQEFCVRCFAARQF